MSSFPLMSDLPLVMETVGWNWCRFDALNGLSMNFWMGVDCHGNKWLTKLRGDFCAYREIVFGRIAQKMGWSCQSSVFIRVDDLSAKLLGVGPGSIHAAHWIVDEHVQFSCSKNCCLEPLVNNSIDKIEDLLALPVAHIWDWPKSELAACLFGGYEPPGKLFTGNHKFVIIDSERMFAGDPCFFDCAACWRGGDIPEPCVVNLSHEVCEDFLSLDRVSLSSVAAVPDGVVIDECWSIESIIYKSYAYARCYICR